jgi:hypothetical protein
LAWPGFLGPDKAVIAHRPLSDGGANQAQIVSKGDGKSINQIQKTRNCIHEQVL